MAFGYLFNLIAFLFVFDKEDFIWDKNKEHVYNSSVFFVLEISVISKSMSYNESWLLHEYKQMISHYADNSIKKSIY